MSMVKKVERQIAGRLLSIETGKLAKQASGAVVVRYGDTIILATVVMSVPREGIDFFPLTVDYREKTSAAGKFPGGFIKREGRPTNKEILTMRMIDRPIRPLFPNGFFNEVQIQVMVLSADQQNDPDILAIIGSSAALAISEIPFEGPLGAVRVGRINDQFVINPTSKELESSTMELVLGGHKGAVNMVEGSLKEVSEDIVADAIEFGHQTVEEICQMISELAADCGNPKLEFTPPDISELLRLLEEKVGVEYRQARVMGNKKERASKVESLFVQFAAEMMPEEGESIYTPEQIRMAIGEYQEKVIREEILKGQRADSRDNDVLREISGEVAVLPRTHGSAIFTRGETQALATATLGTVSDEQIVDGLVEEYRKKFMLHYNFPPFCVGEVRRIVGPGRREIGHGSLAEKSLQGVMPSVEEFPYTVRLVSDVLESNGSSSMASVCAGTLAMMDAGVPIRRPVAGISIGMVSDKDKYVLLTDILGEEDHYGDMDFKVAGTQKGVTAIQLDLKASGVPFEVIRESLERAKNARLKILQTMLSIIDKPRQEISNFAPKIVNIRIPVDMIGKVIGPGGRDIKRIQETTGATIEIEDDGNVYISCIGGSGHLKAKEIIELMTMPIEVGKMFKGRIVAIKDFGAFVELAPGREGLCHISELSDRFVKSVTDVCNIDDEMSFKVIAVDDMGRIKLSHKAVLQEEAAARTGH